MPCNTLCHWWEYASKIWFQDFPEELRCKNTVGPQSEWLQDEWVPHINDFGHTQKFLILLNFAP